MHMDASNPKYTQWAIIIEKNLSKFLQYQAVSGEFFWLNVEAAFA